MEVTLKQCILGILSYHLKSFLKGYYTHSCICSLLFNQLYVVRGFGVFKCTIVINCFWYVELQKEITG